MSSQQLRNILKNFPEAISVICSRSNVNGWVIVKRNNVGIFNPKSLLFIHMDKKNYINIENITITEGAIRFGIKLVSLVKLKSQIEMVFWNLTSQIFCDNLDFELKKFDFVQSWPYHSVGLTTWSVLMFLHEMDEADQIVSLSE